MDVSWVMYVCVMLLVVWTATLCRHWLRPGSLAPLFDPAPKRVARTSESLGKSAGVCSIQGRRGYMEDTFQASVDIGGTAQSAFYGVFDGHGGARAAQFVARHLPSLIVDKKFALNPVAAITGALLQVDENWLAIANQHNFDDGTTAITLLIHKDTMYIGNVGDSRAVLATAGRALALSDDHKPNRDDERERIEALGGRIVHYGTWRVEGMLAVTRAVGDRKLKKWVTAEPEIMQHVISDDDQFVILASDGVWDVLTNEEAVQIALRAGSAKAAADAITEAAYTRGSMDNITTLVVDVQSYRQLGE